MMVKRDANNNQGASLTASRHSLKRFRAFKSHKSDKQNIRNATDEIDGTANLPSTSSSSSALQLLNRPIEKVFEEAQFSLTLNLNDRKLKEFPEQLAHKYDLSDLICAELSNNRLTQMPDFLSSDYFDSLETLVLKNNCLRGQLFSFPSNLKTISYLDLSGNQLNSLSDCLFNLPLKVLLLSSNRLDCLSPKISNLNDTLEELDLSFNRLKCCPPEMGMLSCLSVLNLRNNQLTQLTPAIGQIPQLRLLNLSNNHLSHLPSQLHAFAGSLRSGIDLQVDGNPLVSPPIRVSRKGRLHIAKWLRNLAVEESNQVDCALGAKISSQEHGWNGVNTRCESNASQPLKSQAKNSILPSKSVVKQSEPGKSFGSDSGYASTVDEHRLSHEYTNGSLEDICQGHNQQKEKLAKSMQPDSEKQLCTIDLNKEIMLAYAQTVIEKKKNIVTTTPCLKPTSNNNDCTFLPLQQQQTTNQPRSLENKTIAQYRQNTVSKSVSKCLNPSSSLLSPVLEAGNGTPNQEIPVKTKLASTITKPSTNKPANPSQLAPKSLSSSCSPCSSMCSVVENLPTATIKIADSSVVQAKKIDQPFRNSKPVHQPPKTVQLKPTTATVIKTAGTKNGPLPAPAKVESKTLPRLESKPLAKSVIGKSTPTKSALPTSNRVHPTPSMSKSAISTVKQTPSTQRRVVKAESIPPAETIDKTKVVKSVVNGTEIGVRKANSALNLPKKVASSATNSTAANADSAATSSPLLNQAQAMAALVYENKEKTLASLEDVEKMMDELADGVLLCQLVNRYKPKIVPVVVTPAATEKCLPPPKARRNIENFVAACRKLGVPEASICTATDIMGRQKSSGQVARTVLALSKCVKK